MARSVEWNVLCGHRISFQFAVIRVRNIVCKLSGELFRKDSPMLRLVSGTVLSVLLAFAAASCDTVDQAVDCAKVCQRYDDCVDDDYDVAACRSRCEDRAANDEGFADSADACESCIDDRACVESFPCIGECAAIVP